MNCFHFHNEPQQSLKMRAPILDLSRAMTAKGSTKWITAQTSLRQACTRRKVDLGERCARRSGRGQSQTCLFALSKRSEEMKTDEARPQTLAIDAPLLVWRRLGGVWPPKRIRLVDTKPRFTIHQAITCSPDYGTSRPETQHTSKKHCRNPSQSRWSR
jgi:hypothetical protein